MVHENVLLNNGDDILLNNGGLVLLNIETPGIQIAGQNHSLADLRGIGRRKKRRRRHTAIEAVGQISRIISFTANAKLFRKIQLRIESKISRGVECRMVGKIWKPNQLWMESTVFSNKGIKLPISDIEKMMKEKMKKAKLKKMMKEYRKEFE